MIGEVLLAVIVLAGMIAFGVILIKGAFKGDDKEEES